MWTAIVITAAVAFLAFCYVFHKQREKVRNMSPEQRLELYINTLVDDLKQTPECVESLSVSDVRSYVRSLGITPDVHVPFLANVAREGRQNIVIGVYDTQEDKVKDLRALAPAGLAPDVQQLLDGRTLVVLC